MAKWLKRIGLMLLVLILLILLAAWWLLRSSLPQLDGELALPGLSAPVTIQRDKLGVVTIDSTNETDAMRALGYVHAQERYFEMDLMRRTAAGELAELFGSIALDTDKKHRIHRMRERANKNLETIAGSKLPQLQAYTEGVQAGLASLKTRPWPYLLLRTEPRPWQMADSALVGFAMYFDLQDAGNTRELALLKIRPHLPEALFSLLTGDGTSWDAPLVGDARGDAALPAATEVDLRALPAPPGSKPAGLDPKGTPGSNNFAVSGALTRDGRAIVANDMHLGLRAPNIWFRARLRYSDPVALGGKVDVSGFTLPGMPAVVVGSNGHVAWGFTNGYVDNVDFGAYCLEPADWCLRSQEEQTAEHVERILVRGDRPYDMKIRTTDPMRAPGPRFPAPVTQHLADGTWLMTVWSAYRENAISLDLTRTATARSIRDFMQRPLVGLPAQNLAIADKSGRIAWTIAGNVPEHNPGCDPYEPTPFVRSPVVIQPAGDRASPYAATEAGQARTEASPTSQQPYPPAQIVRNHEGCNSSPMAAGDIPAIADAEHSRLWTANNRTLDGVALQKVGDGGYAFGARAKQIRDDLFAKRQFSEKDLLAIQLDDRALLLQRWWRLLQDESKGSTSPALEALASAAKKWQGRASVDSVSYRIVRAWRLAVHARILDGLTAPAQAAMGDDFVMPDVPQLEGTAWPLVTQRPQNLLSRRYPSWDALFEDAAKEVRDELAKDGPLSQRTWGERNTAAICHPLVKAIPLFGKRLLCMPPDPLPGDSAMPRVQGPAFGASERMVVSPGHEADGIVHMPGGQSGHFLSPFWGVGHDDWVHGRPTPFLPGKTEYTLTLKP